MSKIIKYGLLVLLVYVVAKEAPSLVEKVSDMGSGLGRKGAAVSQSHCIALAEKATKSFAGEMRGYAKPPFDLDAWDLSMERVRGHVYNAEARCDCASDSCQRATEALAELSALISDFDNSLRGDASPLDPARRQETIDRLLKRARELDRQGS